MEYQRRSKEMSRQMMIQENGSVPAWRFHSSHHERQMTAAHGQTAWSQSPSGYRM